MGVFPVERLDKSELVLVNFIQPLKIILANKTYPRHGIINNDLYQKLLEYYEQYGGRII